jgi:ankyrin repeat protein
MQISDELVEAVIAARAKNFLSILHEGGWTCLNNAIMCRYYEQAMRIINVGIDVCVADDRGNSALHYACDMRDFDLGGSEKNLKLVRSILEAGGSSIVDMLNDNDRSALEIAVTQKNHDMASLLLQYGASADMINKCHDTMLSLALKNKDAKMVQLLIAHGADYRYTQSLLDARNRAVLHTLMCINTDEESASLFRILFNTFRHASMKSSLRIRRRLNSS